MDQDLRIVIRVDKQTNNLTATNAELNNLDSATQKVTNSLNQNKQSTNALASAYSTLKGIIASVIGIGMAKEYIKTSDAMSLLEARIKLVSNESDNYGTTQKQLIKIANENRVAYGSVGELYARLSPAMRTLNADTNTVIGVTDAYSKSLLIGGASTEEAAGSTRQFAQAMASGVLRGDEFNSMMENNPRAMRILTESLGKTQGELRKMAENGELASGIVAGALLMNISKLREEASKMPNTISGEFIRIQNEAALTVEEFNKLTGANAILADDLSIVTKKLVEFRTSMDPDQLKQYLGYILQVGEAYVAYKVSTEAARLATFGINSLMETSTRITTAKTAAMVASTEAERLGSIATQTRTLADLARQEAQASGLLVLERHATMLEKEALASSTAAKSATLHSYELQGVAAKAGIASMAMSGLTTAFKTFAPTAILFGITEIFLNWDKITGNVKDNLITASDQLEKMTNNQLDVQANNLKKTIQDVNKELSTNEAIINSSRKAGEARTKENGYGSFIMTDEQLTQAKAQVDTLNQTKDKYETTLNEINELRKKNTAKEVANLDAFTKAERDFREEINKTDLAKVQYEIGAKMIADGEAEVANTKRIKESTAAINTQMSSLEKQYSIQKEIQNLDIESALIAERVTKPEAEYLKEINDIKSQIAKNQATINLLNAIPYDKKNDTNWKTDEIKNLEKANELKKDNELLTVKQAAAEQKKAATIKATNDELLTSINAIDMSDTDKKYQDLAKSVEDLINKGGDLALVGKYATQIADQIAREDAYSHLQTELDIRSQIAEVSLYGTQKETALEQIRHDSMIANLSKELDAKKLNADEYLKLLVIENQRHKQNADSFYQFMLESFDNVNKAMDENFFNAMTGKFKHWGDWFKDFFSSIGTSAAQGLSRTLAGNLTNSLQSSFVNVYKSYGGASGGSSLVGETLNASDLAKIMSSTGTTVSDGVVKTSGGTVIDQATGTVKSQGSDALSILNGASSIKTAYGMLTDGISGSILSGFNSVGNFLGNAGFGSLGSGISQFGAGFSSPFSFAAESPMAGLYGSGIGSTSGATMAGGMLSSGLIGYGIGTIGDKLFGAKTQAANLAAVGATIGSIVPGIGTLLGAAIGAVIGGFFGSTKVTGTRSGVDVGTSTAQDSSGQYYSETDYKKKSWFRSKSWTDYKYQGFSDVEIDAIKKTIGVYDYLLTQFGEYSDLVVSGGRFSSLQNFLDTNVVKAFLGAINPNNLDAIYQTWTDYAKSIDKTVTEALSSAVSSYTTEKRSFTEWKLGSGTVDQLKFTAGYLQSDFEALANSMGASTVTVDNFLSMYDAAIKSNFTQDTIDNWKSLGDSFISATDASKKYKDALDSITNSTTTLSLPEDMLLKNLKVSSTMVDLGALVVAQNTGNKTSSKMLDYIYEIVKAQRALLKAAKFGIEQGIPA